MGVRRRDGAILIAEAEASGEGSPSRAPVSRLCNGYQAQRPELARAMPQSEAPAALLGGIELRLRTRVRRPGDGQDMSEQLC